MAQAGPYARSPLAEAIIDLRCRLDADASLDRLAGLHEGLRDDYPLRRDWMIVESRVTMGPEVGAAARQRQLGYIFVSADERQAIQARLDGFTFSRFKPYDRWETFRDEAHRLWQIYRSALPVETITRVAVRYINRLELPLPLADFKDYLRTVPEVSPDLPQALSGFLMRLEIPQPDMDATLLLTQALVEPEKPNTVGVILDIDLFREYDTGVDDHEAWNFLERLRVRKNDVFEACITERTREGMR